MESISLQITIRRIIQCYYLLIKICSKKLNSDRLEESIYLVITQDDLIKEIAEKEDIDVTTVRDIFKSAENSIFAYLSFTTPSENIVIKLLNGLSLEGEYIPEHMIDRGIFKNHECSERIKVKANITKYYKNKLNK